LNIPSVGAYLSLNFFDVLAAAAVEDTAETATAAVAAAEAIKLRRVMFLRSFILILLKVRFIVLLHSPPLRIYNALSQILTTKKKNARLQAE
jgi:hypothetical protein